jgi:hypothetical protein
MFKVSNILLFGKKFTKMSGQIKMEKNIRKEINTNVGSKEIKSNKIIDLDENVLLALDFFTKNPPPPVDTGKFRSPFVVGSGNAYNTGTILFSGKDAILADESNFKSIIASSDKNGRDGQLRDAVVISASGGKDSGWEIDLANEYGLKTTLLTTKPQSEGAKKADEVIAFKSIDEPYTYNTSTYMGMILGATHENPSKIKEAVKNLNFPESYGKYKGYAFVVPDRFKQICPMLETKRNELFGPHVSVRAVTQGNARHAIFVVRSPEELVITLGQKNENFGDPDHRWDVDLPQDADFATVMAMTYYMVGKIQASKPPYFKLNIGRYTSQDGPRGYGKTAPFDVIVPGSGV